MSDLPQFPLLDSISNPNELKHLPRSCLPQLAKELREFLIDCVSKSGGHFAAGLGVVELTIALHYVFDTPNDHLVWDVGHQCYPHKVLTERRNQLHSIRQQGGLAPFPTRWESPYDSFGVGHSSTSISAALGFAIASQLLGQTAHHVAIIGDGAMTAGMAFEALNHAGDLKANILVILNDNNMSISPNVGALSNRVTRVLSNPVLQGVRAEGKRVLSHLPAPMLHLARRAEEHVKGMVSPGTLFEEFGFQYFGPIDGHDFDALIDTLSNLKQQSGPRLLHVITKKGKGYPRAESAPVTYHAVSRFDAALGMPPASPSTTYTQVFSDWLVDMAEHESRLVAITPAMREGSGLVDFSERFPDRYFDAAIAEQHAVTLAAGMACRGLKPVVAIYSTFLQRAYDQLIHDVAIQNLPVLLAIDRAGLVGPDGATHAGSFDLSFLRCIPNLTIMAPADEAECRVMLNTGFSLNSPVAIRYPRGKGSGARVVRDFQTIPVGEAQWRRHGQKLAILAFGSLVTLAEQLGETLNASVINMRFIKPLDHKMIEALAQSHTHFVTLEENAIAGGAGSAVSEYVVQANIQIKMKHFGLPDLFLEHGERSQLLNDIGLSESALLQQCRDFIRL